jgi:membrane-bound lytic murein transglycosylase D
MLRIKWLALNAAGLLILCVGEASVAQMNTYSRVLFPTPEVLKPNVEFWKNIYAKYSEREVVLHDSEDLGIVYEVVNLDTLFRGAQVSERLKWKKIEDIKRDYRSVLLALANKGILEYAALSQKEKQIEALFGTSFNPSRLKRAAYNIRTQSGLRERFKLGLQRSGVYISKMREVFREAALPLELLVLPHVESSFNYKAYSKMGAAGIWQFTRGTGRRYMKINYEVDERLDPITATECAAEHLKRNFETLGNWPLAITAYNHGLNGMVRAQKLHGNDLGEIVQNYQSRSFGFASRNFYAEFLAALHVSNNFTYYFGVIQFHEPIDFAVFQTTDYITVNTLLKTLQIELEEFAKLNPALRPPVLESKRRIPRNFAIRLPAREDLNIGELYAKISPQEKFAEQIRPEWHKVETGENLSLIAQKYGVTLRELMALNNLDHRQVIYAGQNLQIPAGAKAGLETSSATTASVETPTQLAEATESRPKEKTSVTDVPPAVTISPVQVEALPIEPPAADTRSGSSSSREPNLVSITSTSPANAESPADGTTPAEQMMENRTASIAEEMTWALPDFYAEVTKSMSTRIVRIPQYEVVQESFRNIAFPENGQVKVEPDETLGHFAEWLEVPARKLRAINRLDYDQPIRIEQSLWLTFEKVTPEEFHRRRLEHHQTIEEDFYHNYRIVGENLYKVRRGENIWIISNRVFEIPYWLVKKYNPNTDLLSLMGGQELVIPIVVAKNGGVINEKL